MGCYGPKLLWAELTRDFCLLPRFVDSIILLERMSTPMPMEASRVFIHMLFVFVLLVPCFLSTSKLYYIESQKPRLFLRKRQQVAAFTTLTFQTFYFSLQVQTSIRIRPKPVNCIKHISGI